MRFPPAPAPFTTRIACVGTLSIEGRSSGPLDILLDVPNTEGRMRGWVLGNSATARAVNRLWRPGVGAMRLEAHDGSSGIASDNVYILATTSIGAGQEQLPDGLHGAACRFECLDLTQHRKSEDHGTPREVRFLLQGPRVSGMLFWSTDRSYTGATTVKLTPTPLITGHGLPFTISVVPHFFFNVPESPGDDLEELADANVVGQTYALACVCRTRKSAREYADDAFLAESKRAVEDACLLLSWLAGGMVVWRTYMQGGGGMSVRHDRSLSRPSAAASSRQMIDGSALRTFMRIAFRRLRRLRSQGVDLEVPLVSVIAGAQARVSSKRFGDFFLALEAIHSLERERRRDTLLLDDRRFRRVAGRLRAAVVEALHAEGVRAAKIAEQMTAKLSELNRPTLWAGVRALMERLRVDWEDLYPEPTPDRPTFLKLRNTLFHSHARADDETIYREGIRVEAVVNRILLRWLGWEDLWNVPRPEVRHFLTGSALPARHRLSGRARKRRRSSETKP